MTKNDMVLTIPEIALMTLLIANLDPDRNPNPRTKALIYKCKAAKQDKPDNLVVLP